MRRKSLWFAIFFLFASVLGFVDASYLTINHFAHRDTICLIVEGCDRVLRSHYATVAFNIPVALMGALYYIVIAALAVAGLVSKDESFLAYAARFTVVGLLASLWFVYLQLFVLRAICTYCMFSALTSLVLFTAGMLFLRKRRSEQPA